MNTDSHQGSGRDPLGEGRHGTDWVYWQPEMATDKPFHPFASTGNRTATPFLVL
ncbi:MAG: hypothetical protein L0Z07_00805 [Planctomycetes bacterium]|nr:hypothetical protein [Planctomycetota bacterium]